MLKIKNSLAQQQCNTFTPRFNLINIKPHKNPRLDSDQSKTFLQIIQEKYDNLLSTIQSRKENRTIQLKQSLVPQTDHEVRISISDLEYLAQPSPKEQIKLNDLQQQLFRLTIKENQETTPLSVPESSLGSTSNWSSAEEIAAAQKYLPKGRVRI